MAQPQAKQIHYNQWYWFVSPSATFRGRIMGMGGLTARVEVCGYERMVDTTAYEVYSDLTQDGVLEVRFLWSRWTLTVAIKDGVVCGSITGQSAKTVEYEFACNDQIFQVKLGCPYNPEAPDTAELTLLSMMRKWRRRLEKNK